jgi:hypothetical protein
MADITRPSILANNDLKSLNLWNKHTTDNIDALNSARGTVTARLTHGVPLATIVNPLRYAPAGILAISSAAVDGGTQYNVAHLNWSVVANSNNALLSVTAYFDQSATGVIGEHTSDYRLRSNFLAIASTAVGNIASIALTAGDWDISAVAGFFCTSTPTYMDLAINTSVAMPVLNSTCGDSAVRDALNFAANCEREYAIPSWRVSLSGNQTYYLVMSPIWAGASFSAYGRISATRAKKYDTAVVNDVTLLVYGS